MGSLDRYLLRLSERMARFGYSFKVNRRFRYLDTLTIAFVVVLLVSNLVGPKICKIGPLLVSGAQLLFPITYVCGDIFTEVYGYAASRRAIWLGFFGMGLLTVMGQIAVALPPAAGWPNQQAFETVFGLVPRFAMAHGVAIAKPSGTCSAAKTTRKRSRADGTRLHRIK